jgi:hypothetical protein
VVSLFRREGVPISSRSRGHPPNRLDATVGCAWNAVNSAYRFSAVFGVLSTLLSGQNPRAAPRNAYADKSNVAVVGVSGPLPRGRVHSSGRETHSATPGGCAHRPHAACRRVGARGRGMLWLTPGLSRHLADTSRLDVAFEAESADIADSRKRRGGSALAIMSDEAAETSPGR